jgi:glycosylphosphatidylinositol transamidase
MSFFRRHPDATLARIQRRNALFAALAKSLPYIIPTLLVLGYAWFAALPSPQLGRRTYIDENALGPGQVL